MFNGRTKHIGTRVHFIRDHHITSEEIKIKIVHTLTNPADMLSKALPAGKLCSWVGQVTSLVIFKAYILTYKES